MKDKSITFRVNKELYDFLKKKADEDMTSISYILTQYILKKYIGSKNDVKKKLSNM